jgi:hypothetical protein
MSAFPWERQIQADEYDGLDARLAELSTEIVRISNDRDPHIAETQFKKWHRAHYPKVLSCQAITIDDRT